VESATYESVTGEPPEVIKIIDVPEEVRELPTPLGDPPYLDGNEIVKQVLTWRC